MRLLFGLLAAALALLLAGRCATVTSEPREMINITTEPSGADVSIDCASEKTTLITPARFAVDRKWPDCSVTVRKEGFETETTVIEQGLNRWTWANLPIAGAGIVVLGVSGFSNNGDDSARVGGALILTGVGGLIIDRLTWKMRDHDPKTLHVKLRPSPPH